MMKLKGKRKMVREALSSLPWLGASMHGWGGGFVWPAPVPAAALRAIGGQA